MTFKLRGKISTFGGPRDTGVSRTEGLALIGAHDLREWWFARLFLPEQPEGTTGLARRLNPAAFYIAMRWGQDGLPANRQARRAIFRLTNPNANPVRTIFAQAADWGPNARTGRLVDMSPGAASALGLETDQIVEVEMIS